MHTIGFFLFPNFQLLDLTGPLAVFQMAPWYQDGADYTVRYFSADGGPVPSSVGIPIATKAVSGQVVGTLIVVGGFGVRLAAAQGEAQAAVRPWPVPPGGWPACARGRSSWRLRGWLRAGGSPPTGGRRPSSSPGSPT